MNAKEVRKGIEEAEERSSVGGWLVFQVIFVSCIVLIPTGHWIAALITFLLLSLLIAIKKTKVIGLSLLTLSASAGFSFLLFLITGIWGAAITFITLFIVFGMINYGHYLHAKEDWSDREKNRV